MPISRLRAYAASRIVFEICIRAATSSNPAGTSCAACHQKSYCENCHKSGAVKVKHETMLYNHANAATMIHASA